jgi:hypothetical protein
MTVRTRQHRLRPPAFDGRLMRRARRAPVPPPAEPSVVADARERDSGGPEDRALYRCQCGFVFEASVSTDVGCPHCGDAQAW